MSGNLDESDCGQRLTFENEWLSTTIKAHLETKTLMLGSKLGVSPCSS